VWCETLESERGKSVLPSLCVCVCVLKCVCVCECINVCESACLSVCAYVRDRECVSVFLSVCVCLCVCVWKCVCMCCGKFERLEETSFAVKNVSCWLFLFFQIDAAWMDEKSVLAPSFASPHSLLFPTSLYRKIFIIGGANSCFKVLPSASSSLWESCQQLLLLLLLLLHSCVRYCCLTARLWFRRC